MQMTRKRLEIYPDLMKAIRILRQEKEAMNTSDIGLGHSIINDYTTGYARPQAVIGFDEKRYKRICSQLDEKEQEANEILRWVEDIEDVITQKVFKLFYIDNYNWLEVAKQTGYAGNPDYPRLMIRDKYLKEKGIK